jgi:hypothetical protein
MKSIAPFIRTSALVALVLLASGLPAAATSHPVGFNYLTSSATVTTPFEDGDTLLLDTLITSEIGALLQEITFTAGGSVAGVQGFAAWQISEEDGAAPRLIDVNIDILDAGDNVVLSDTFEGVLAGFAHSTITGALDPGTYRLVVTGNAIRDAVLDVSLTFTPEPGTAVLLLAGLGGLAFAGRRTRTVAAS